MEAVELEQTEVSLLVEEGKTKWFDGLAFGWKIEDLVESLMIDGFIFG